MSENVENKKTLKDFFIQDKCLWVCMIAIIPAMFGINTYSNLWLVYLGCFIVIVNIALVKAIRTEYMSKYLNCSNDIDNGNNESKDKLNNDITSRALQIQKGLVSINNFYILIFMMLLVHIPADTTFVCHRSECWDGFVLLIEIFIYAISLLPITIIAICLSLKTKKRLRSATFDDQVSSSVHRMIKHDYLFKVLSLLLMFWPLLVAFGM